MTGLLASLLIVLLGAWVSSRDEIQAARESGPGLGEPTLASVPGPAVTLSPISTSPQPAVPVRLAIPSIAVRAPVLPVDKLDDGSQGVPHSFDEVGWYAGGSMPGQPGNAVMTGHTWSRGDGVFDRLPQLVEGDIITVVTEKGKQDYRVSSVGSFEQVDFGRFAADIYRTDGASGLVLMTCGNWNGSVHTATTVVYAELTS